MEGYCGLQLLRYGTILRMQSKFEQTDTDINIPTQEI